MVKTLRDQGWLAVMVSPALYIGGWGCACNHEMWAHQAELFPPPNLRTKRQAPRYHGAIKSHALQPATYCYAFVCLRCNKDCFSRFRLATSYASLKTSAFTNVAGTPAVWHDAVSMLRNTRWDGYAHCPLNWRRRR